MWLIRSNVLTLQEIISSRTNNALGVESELVLSLLVKETTLVSGLTNRMIVYMSLFRQQPQSRV